MPYVHTRDVKRLGVAVKAMCLAEDMSTQDICQLVERAQRRNDRKFSISKDSVRRLVLGQPLGMSEALRVLYRAMMESDDYRHYLIDAGFPAEENRHDFPGALQAFFQPDRGIAPKFRLDQISCLQGEYVMYRRDYEGLLSAENGVRVSSLFIDDVGGGKVVVREEQKFNHPLDGTPFSQSDTGHLFCYGPHVHFLMKEPNGGCVKLGAIRGPDNELVSEVTQYFYGALYVASWNDMYARALFFCKRCGPNVPVVPNGIVHFGDIADARIGRHIGDDFPGSVNRRGVP